MNPLKSKFLKFALNSGALEFIPGEGRKLKSGRMSPYFFNSGLFIDGPAVNMLLDIYLQCLEENQIITKLQPDIIFGPAYKGITLCYGLNMKINLPNIEYAFNRKEVKKHGEGGTIVGANLKGKRILIIDDVITAGTAIREALDIIKSEGGIPVGCLVCFDRQEKAPGSDLSAIQQVHKDFNLPVEAALTLEDLISLIQGNQEYQEILQNILSYREKYGIDV